MKTKHTMNWKKRFLIPGAITAFALVASPVILSGVFDSDAGIMSTAYAAADGKGGKGGPGYRGGQGGGDAASTGHAGSGSKGGRRTLDDVLRDVGGDDSDAPPWAGTPGREGKPGAGSHGSDVKKGGDYGDLWIILRDDDGNPIYVRWVDGVQEIYPGEGEPEEGWYVQPLAADGSAIPLDVEGHPVDESLTQEVELGRLNIARAPSRVLSHALDEAVTKLDGVVVTADNIENYTDTAGRLMVDGVAIDSPLENLALYASLVNTDPNADGNIVITVTVSSDGGSSTSTLTVDADVAMQLAAAAFAAASDKTGTLSIDGIAYISGFLDVNITAAVDTFTYDREAVYGDETVWILVNTGTEENPVYVPDEVNIMDVVQFNTITPIEADGNGIDTFAQAADDALQVIEYIHDNALQ
ncbi:MAG: hypothetical protein EP315_04305 [Gammaproteobacteria bacterium]|nr:MAG: hypothetical protein EP315_04305 [Gammaproteobacteria bacterium]